jgi:hypothetical protein
MDNKKIKIEEIKLLIPDYVTGSLNEKDKRLVEDALKSSKELQDFYNEVRDTLQFVKAVKLEEPLPQYWNNLLPRIHQRIEEREQKRLFGFRKPMSLVWKFLLPVTAVILIFIIYRIAFTPGTQYTSKEKVVKTDTGTIQRPNNMEQAPKEKPTLGEKSKANNIELKPPNVYRKRSNEENRSFLNGENIVENKKQIEENNLSSELNLEEDTTTDFSLSSEFSPLNLGVTQVFSEAQPGTFDEEMENELDRLNNVEKEKLLNDLENTNL